MHDRFESSPRDTSVQVFTDLAGWPQTQSIQDLGYSNQSPVNWRAGSIVQQHGRSDGYAKASKPKAGAFADDDAGKKVKAQAPHGCCRHDRRCCCLPDRYRGQHSGPRWRMRAHQGHSLPVRLVGQCLPIVPMPARSCAAAIAGHGDWTDRRCQTQRYGERITWFFRDDGWWSGPLHGLGAAGDWRRTGSAKSRFPPHGRWHLSIRLMTLPRTVMSEKPDPQALAQITAGAAGKAGPHGGRGHGSANTSRRMSEYALQPLLFL